MQQQQMICPVINDGLLHEVMKYHVKAGRVASIAMLLVLHTWFIGYGQQTHALRLLPELPAMYDIWQRPDAIY